MKDRKKLLIIVLAVALLAVLTIGITYAAFTFSKEGNNENKLTTGTVTMIYTEGTNKISITNAMPITDEEGIILTNEDQVFDFTVAITITGSQSISYEVTAEKDSSSSLANNDVKLYLERSIDGTTYDKVADPSNYVELTKDDDFGAKKGEMVLDTNIASVTSTYYYKLRMWVSKDYVVTEDSKSFTIKVNVYGKNSSSIKVDASKFTYTDSEGNEKSLDKALDELYEKMGQ